jgi:hypothetical protein
LSTHDWLLEGQDDDATAFRRKGSLEPRRLHGLAPSGPRPNALPLHNVRYQKTRPFTQGASHVNALEAPNASKTKPIKTASEGLGGGSAAPPNLAQPCQTQGQDLGGARRDRTDDLMLAKHALSQLSYGPVSRPAGAQRPVVVVGLGGLEPPTSRLSSARSNQLSYKPGRKKKSYASPIKPIKTQVFPYP